jgi:hypothetical protein
MLEHDLVDPFWLKIFPITLGGGKRLFADGTIPAAFKVTESRVTSKASLSSITSLQAQSQPEVYKRSRRGGHLTAGPRCVDRLELLAGINDAAAPVVFKVPDYLVERFGGQIADENKPRRSAINSRMESPDYSR